MSGYIGTRPQTCRSYPGLDGRVFVRQEAEVEVPGPLSVEREAVHALIGVSGDEVLEE